jgi:hypothetical protein
MGTLNDWKKECKLIIIIHALEIKITVLCQAPKPKN